MKPYLKHIINNLEKSDTWKNQLTIAINIVSFKNTDEECVMHSKIDNIEIMICNKEDEVIKEISKHFLIDIKSGWRHGLILSLIVLIFCITNIIK